MKQCDYCGTENEDSATSCRDCATQFTTSPAEPLPTFSKPTTGIASRLWRLNPRRLVALLILLALFLGLLALLNRSALFLSVFLGGSLPVFAAAYYASSRNLRGMGVRILFFVCAISSCALILAVPYGEGLGNSVWVVPLFLPAVIMPWLWLLLSCFALLVLWMASFICKRQLIETSVMFIFSVALVISSAEIKPYDLYLRGFNHYVTRSLNDAQWREISQFIQAHPPPDGRLPGPGKTSLWSGENREPWKALCTATSIQQLDPTLTIYHHTGFTEIVWGGALIGHRGVVIFAHPKDIPALGGFLRTNFIADDIATFVSE